MPTGADYQQAIQSPKLTLADGELKAGAVLTNALGLPKTISGTFGVVFTMDCATRRYAVKCFYRQYKDLFERYNSISAYLQGVQRPWEVEFEFISPGIQLAGQWYPLVKMEWADALRLDRYVETHLSQPLKLAELAGKFSELVDDLRREGIAHGDLQHGNILVMRDGSLRLVDYDGMYVPALDSLGSHEVGHPNYQHPARSAAHFGPYLDNFSAWIIYTSLVGLSVDPGIWGHVRGGDDRLLFGLRDFQQPATAPVFQILRQNGNAKLRSLADNILLALRAGVPDVPPLESVALAPGEIAKSQRTATSRPKPGWMQAPATPRFSLPRAATPSPALAPVVVVRRGRRRLVAGAMVAAIAVGTGVAIAVTRPSSTGHPSSPATTNVTSNTPAGASRGKSQPAKAKARPAGIARKRSASKQKIAASHKAVKHSPSTRVVRPLTVTARTSSAPTVSGNRVRSSPSSGGLAGTSTRPPSSSGGLTGSSNSSSNGSGGLTGSGSP